MLGHPETTDICALPVAPKETNPGFETADCLDRCLDDELTAGSLSHFVKFSRISSCTLAMSCMNVAFRTMP